MSVDTATFVVIPTLRTLPPGNLPSGSPAFCIPACDDRASATLSCGKWSSRSSAAAPRGPGNRLRLTLFLSLMTAALLLPFVPSSAEAGVLLRSQRVSSRVRVRPPRIRLGSPRPSTAAYARLNPIHSDSLNTPSYEYKLVQRERKYQQKLYAWRLKQARLLEREKVKERRKKEQERKKDEKMAKKRGKAQAAAATGSSEGTSGSVTSGGDKNEIGATERIVKGQKIQGEKKKKLSFWSRFWRALFPRGSSQPQQPAQQSPQS